MKTLRERIEALTAVLRILAKHEASAPAATDPPADLADTQRPGATGVTEVAPPPAVVSASLSDWEIDRSTASPILTYRKCSVIQDEQAEFVLGLVRAALGAPAAADPIADWIRANPSAPAAAVVQTERPIDLWRRMPEPTGAEPASELAAVLAVARRDLLTLAAALAAPQKEAP